MTQNLKFKGLYLESELIKYHNNKATDSGFIGTNQFKLNIKSQGPTYANEENTVEITNYNTTVFNLSNNKN